MTQDSYVVLFFCGVAAFTVVCRMVTGDDEYPPNWFTLAFLGLAMLGVLYGHTVIW